MAAYELMRPLAIYLIRSSKIQFILSVVAEGQLVSIDNFGKSPATKN